MEMTKLFLFFVIFGLMQYHLSHALMECFKCEDSTECSKDKDFCDGHDRCMKMEYNNFDGEKVNKANCATETECDTEAGKMLLCSEKNNCKINTCCKEDLCNSPAVLVRFNLKLLATVAMAICVLLKRW